MKRRKYKRMLNTRRRGWFVFPWREYSLLGLDGRIAVLSSGLLGDFWNVRIVCENIH